MNPRSISPYLWVPLLLVLVAGVGWATFQYQSKATLESAQVQSPTDISVSPHGAPQALEAGTNDTMSIDQDIYKPARYRGLVAVPVDHQMISGSSTLPQIQLIVVSINASQEAQVVDEKIPVKNGRWSYKLKLPHGQYEIGFADASSTTDGPVYDGNLLVLQPSLPRADFSGFTYGGKLIHPECVWRTQDGDVPLTSDCLVSGEFARATSTGEEWLVSSTPGSLEYRSEIANPDPAIPQPDVENTFWQVEGASNGKFAIESGWNGDGSNVSLDLSIYAIQGGVLHRLQSFGRSDSADIDSCHMAWNERMVDGLLYFDWPMKPSSFFTAFAPAQYANTQVGPDSETARMAGSGFCLGRVTYTYDFNTDTIATSSISIDPDSYHLPTDACFYKTLSQEQASSTMTDAQTRQFISDFIATCHPSHS